MSYTKQTWQTGDTVTAERLNHMEDGIAGEGALIIDFDNIAGYTYEQIHAVLTDGGTVYGTGYGYEYDAVISLRYIELSSEYIVSFASGHEATADAADIPLSWD